MAFEYYVDNFNEAAQRLYMEISKEFSKIETPFFNQFSEQCSLHLDPRYEYKASLLEILGEHAKIQHNLKMKSTLENILASDNSVILTKKSKRNRI